MFNRGFEFFEVYGFHQMFRKACLDTVLNIAVHPEAADRDASYSRFCPQMGHEFQATAIRQANIADEEIEMVTFSDPRAECMSCVVATV